MDTVSPDRLLRLPEAWERLGVSRPTFYRLRRTDPRFPKLVKLGAASRISERALETYIATLAAGEVSDGF